MFKIGRQKVELKVEGVSCPHCVLNIENAVAVLEGVKNVKVDVKRKSTKVEFDSDLVSLDKIKEIIWEQGFEVR
ncbi:MAG TPA: copper resistance protein CopZ [Firmicutes bacterium]|nr:copper resistance protein CopZ [Bacillota bacterium]HBK68724.1 copper resistance protein CopZ [Bacillota bacterium]